MLHEYQMGQLDRNGAVFACRCGATFMEPTLDEADVALEAHIKQANNDEAEMN